MDPRYMNRPPPPPGWWNRPPAAPGTGGPWSGPPPPNWNNNWPRGPPPPGPNFPPPPQTSSEAGATYQNWWPQNASQTHANEQYYWGQSREGKSGDGYFPHGDGDAYGRGVWDGKYRDYRRDERSLSPVYDRDRSRSPWEYERSHDYRRSSRERYKKSRDSRRSSRDYRDKHSRSRRDRSYDREHERESRHSSRDKSRSSEPRYSSHRKYRTEKETHSPGRERGNLTSGRYPDQDDSSSWTDSSFEDNGEPSIEKKAQKSNKQTEKSLKEEDKTKSDVSSKEKLKSKSIDKEKSTGDRSDKEPKKPKKEKEDMRDTKSEKRSREKQSPSSLGEQSGKNDKHKSHRDDYYKDHVYDDYERYKRKKHDEKYRYSRHSSRDRDFDNTRTSIKTSRDANYEKSRDSKKYSESYDSRHVIHKKKKKVVNLFDEEDEPSSPSKTDKKRTNYSKELVSRKKSEEKLRSKSEEVNTGENVKKVKTSSSRLESTSEKINVKEKASKKPKDRRVSKNSDTLASSTTTSSSDSDSDSSSSDSDSSSSDSESGSSSSDGRRTADSCTENKRKERNLEAGDREAKLSHVAIAEPNDNTTDDPAITDGPKMNLHNRNEEDKTSQSKINELPHNDIKNDATHEIDIHSLGDLHQKDDHQVEFQQLIDTVNKTNEDLSQIEPLNQENETIAVCPNEDSKTSDTNAVDNNKTKVKITFKTNPNVVFPTVAPVSGSLITKEDFSLDTSEDNADEVTNQITVTEDQSIADIVDGIDTSIKSELIHNEVTEQEKIIEQEVDVEPKESAEQKEILPGLDLLEGHCVSEELTNKQPAISMVNLVLEDQGNAENIPSGMVAEAVEGADEMTKNEMNTNKYVTTNATKTSEEEETDESKGKTSGSSTVKTDQKPQKPDFKSGIGSKSTGSQKSGEKQLLSQPKIIPLEFSEMEVEEPSTNPIQSSESNSSKLKDSPSKKAGDRNIFQIMDSISGSSFQEKDSQVQSVTAIKTENHQLSNQNLSVFREENADGKISTVGNISVKKTNIEGIFPNAQLNSLPVEKGSVSDSLKPRQVLPKPKGSRHAKWSQWKQSHSIVDLFKGSSEGLSVLPRGVNIDPASLPESRVLQSKKPSSPEEISPKETSDFEKQSPLMEKERASQADISSSQTEGNQTDMSSSERIESAKTLLQGNCDYFSENSQGADNKLIENAEPKNHNRGIDEITTKVTVGSQEDVLLEVGSKTTSNKKHISLPEEDTHINSKVEEPNKSNIDKDVSTDSIQISTRGNAIEKSENQVEPEESQSAAKDMPSTLTTKTDTTLTKESPDSSPESKMETTIVSTKEQPSKEEESEAIESEPLEYFTRADWDAMLQKEEKGEKSSELSKLIKPTSKRIRKSSSSYLTQSSSKSSRKMDSNSVPSSGDAGERIMIKGKNRKSSNNTACANTTRSTIILPESISFCDSSPKGSPVKEGPCISSDKPLNQGENEIMPSSSSKETVDRSGNETFHTEESSLEAVDTNFNDTDTIKKPLSSNAKEKYKVLFGTETEESDDSLKTKTKHSKFDTEPKSSKDDQLEVSHELSISPNLADDCLGNGYVSYSEDEADKISPVSHIGHRLRVYATKTNTSSKMTTQFSKKPVTHDPNNDPVEDDIFTKNKIDNNKLASDEIDIPPLASMNEFDIGANDVTQDIAKRTKESLTKQSSSDILPSKDSPQEKMVHNRLTSDVDSEGLKDMSDAYASDQNEKADQGDSLKNMFSSENDKNALDTDLLKPKAVIRNPGVQQEHSVNKCLSGGKSPKQRVVVLSPKVLHCDSKTSPLQKLSSSKVKKNELEDSKTSKDNKLQGQRKIECTDNTKLTVIVANKLEIPKGAKTLKGSDKCDKKYKTGDVNIESDKQFPCDPNSGVEKCIKELPESEPGKEHIRRENKKSSKSGTGGNYDSSSREKVSNLESKEAELKVSLKKGVSPKSKSRTVVDSEVLNKETSSLAKSKRVDPTEMLYEQDKHSLPAKQSSSSSKKHKKKKSHTKKSKHKEHKRKRSRSQDSASSQSTSAGLHKKSKRRRGTSDSCASDGEHISRHRPEQKKPDRSRKYHTNYPKISVSPTAGNSRNTSPSRNRSRSQSVEDRKLNTRDYSPENCSKCGASRKPVEEEIKEFLYKRALAGYHLVEFPSSEAAHHAMAYFSGRMICDLNPARKEQAQGHEHSKPSEFIIRVDNLSKDIDDLELFRVFSRRYPSCRSVKVEYDRDRRSKGYGYVYFSQEADYERALTEMGEKSTSGEKKVTASAVTPRRTVHHHGSSTISEQPKSTEATGISEEQNQENPVQEQKQENQNTEQSPPEQLCYSKLPPIPGVGPLFPNETFCESDAESIVDPMETLDVEKANQEFMARNEVLYEDLDVSRWQVKSRLQVLE